MNNRLEDYFLSIIFSIFIITFAVCFVIFFKPFYAFEINQLHLCDTLNYSKAYMIKNYNQLINYQSIFYHSKLVLDFKMSDTGRIHFEEVKRIFEIIQYVCIITGIISIPMVVRNLVKKEYRFLGLTSFFVIIIPGCLMFLVALNFDQAFVMMHKLLFNNDYWLFDPSTDPIINILPDTYFYHCFIFIVLIVIITGTICYLVYRYHFKRITEKA